MKVRKERGVIVPTDCFFQGCDNPIYEREIKKCKKICEKYNRVPFSGTKKKGKILRRLLGCCGDGSTVVAPFWCDYGYHIFVGKRFYANHNFVVQDGAAVTIGDDVFIGPNCVITTAEHAIDPEMRRAGIEIAKPVTIKNNVWLGAGVRVLAGVTIGENCVIGAGSVVTKDIPANTVAFGVPCRVYRSILEADIPITYPREL